MASKGHRWLGVVVTLFAAASCGYALPNCDYTRQRGTWFQSYIGVGTDMMTREYTDADEILIRTGTSVSATLVCEGEAPVTDHNLFYLVRDELGMRHCYQENVEGNVLSYRTMGVSSATDATQCEAMLASSQLDMVFNIKLPFSELSPALCGVRPGDYFVSIENRASGMLYCEDDITSTLTATVTSLTVSSCYRGVIDNEHPYVTTFECIHALSPSMFTTTTNHTIILSKTVIMGRTEFHCTSAEGSDIMADFNTYRLSHSRPEGLVCDFVDYDTAFRVYSDHCDRLLPCLNSGTCIQDVGFYTCQCVDGYTGENCETEIDSCANRPCQNAGICVKLTPGYLCDCRAGYSGDNCQISERHCDKRACHNGGSCYDLDESSFCRCVPPYSGDNCQDLDACSLEPCGFAQKCEADSITGSYTCTTSFNWLPLAIVGGILVLLLPLLIYVCCRCGWCDLIRLKGEPRALRKKPATKKPVYSNAGSHGVVMSPASAAPVNTNMQALVMSPARAAPVNTNMQALVMSPASAAPVNTNTQALAVLNVPTANRIAVPHYF